MRPNVPMLGFPFNALALVIKWKGMARQSTQIIP